MSMFSVRSARSANGHAVPILAGGVLAVTAVALIAYLLWPTWRAGQFKGPERLPVSIGGTVFNVPSAAIRVKIQRHTGPQERVDLGFDYPSLTPPEAPHHVSADQIDQTPHPIDRIFVSISAHHDAMSPETRLKTIYPRYLNPAAVSVQDGLTMRGFRAGTPYDVEDLFVAEQPALAARCTRDAATPGMCLSERRVDGADMVFRFPRSWLSQWQDVASAMERLTAQMHAVK
ncbi:hypothetical protein ACQR1I_11580 [Bradyrhizobium sp. HKCCYLS2038]|uniref:hypothetical protein n=1 Tax=unclassified Bradyrhizobium TaxID=2631580 RepID=UPI003EB96694